MIVQFDNESFVIRLSVLPSTMSCSIELTHLKLQCEFYFRYTMSVSYFAAWSPNRKKKMWVATVLWIEEVRARLLDGSNIQECRLTAFKFNIDCIINIQNGNMVSTMIFASEKRGGTIEVFISQFNRKRMLSIDYNNINIYQTAVHSCSQ